jgi:ribA/ribD-fused uncharacterized protein
MAAGGGGSQTDTGGFAMMVADDCILFWGGWLSQWYKAPMMLQGLRFACCEQFMMAGKAKLFGDDDAFAEIMETDNPRRHKEIGRKVQNFSIETWDRHAQEIVTIGNYAKFTQNDRLKDLLLNETGRMCIAEATSDSVWGIGLHRDDPAIGDRKQWKGRNLLGKCLMEVRRHIREGTAPDSTFIGTLFGGGSL